MRGTEHAQSQVINAIYQLHVGHMSRRMLEHYSHVRMAAKRTALDKLESGLMGALPIKSQTAVGKVNWAVTSQSTPQRLASNAGLSCK